MESSPPMVVNGVSGVWVFGLVNKEARLRRAREGKRASFMCFEYLA